MSRAEQTHERLESHIAAVVSKAPALTATQLDRIAGLLRPLGGEQA